MKALLALLVVLGVACGDDDVPPVDGGSSDGALDAAMPDGGPTCTTLAWDPDDGRLTRWPEPRLLVDDATTLTGKRLRFVAADYPGLELAGGFLPILTEDLADLDGFGTSAGAFFQFEGLPFDPALVPTGTATSAPSAGLGLVVLAPGPPRIEPVLVRLTDEGRTPIVEPMHPLPGRGLAALFVTRALTEAAGGCLEPSPAMAAALAAPDAEMTTALAALATLGIADDASDVVALTVFPTQSTTDESLAIAADIASRDYALEAPATCTTTTRWIECTAAFVAPDYRDADGVVRRDTDAVAPVTTYRLPVRIWLPLTGTRPFPMILFGHGLGSGSQQGADLAEGAAERGLATVAISALEHGDHPTSPDPKASTIDTALRFFAFGDIETRAVQSLVLRDNFRQSLFDKLALTRLLGASPDIDGDGAADLDGTRMAYLGASLGGIMGGDLLALTDAYPAAVLAVPGARLISIISDGATFGPLIRLLRPRGATEGDVERFFPIVQTIVERGDGVNYAPFVLRDRLVGAPTDPPPSVILGVALDDEIVPNVASWSLARALDVPITPVVLRSVPGLVELTTTPVSGNIAGGRATAGLVQFDVLREDSGEVVPATHDQTPGSAVGARAWLEFLDAHFRGGLAVIVDPYALEGLDHAPPAP